MIPLLEPAAVPCARPPQPGLRSTRRISAPNRSARCRLTTAWSGQNGGP